MLKPRCLICKRLGEVHHALTRKAYPEFKDEEFNLFELCRQHHSEWHSKGMSYMMDRWPVIKKTALKKGWWWNETLNKWWPKLWH